MLSGCDGCFRQVSLLSEDLLVLFTLQWEMEPVLITKTPVLPIVLVTHPAF